MKNKILLLLLSCSVVGFSNAATDGTLGPTSTGTANLSVNVNAPTAPEIEITGIEDFNWGNVDDGTELPPITISNICVRMTNAATYSIAIASLNDNGGSLFEMQSSSLDNFGQPLTLGYSTLYEDAVGNIAITNGSGLFGSTAATCSAGELASLTIDPGTAILNSADPFANVSYSDTLILTVAPD